LSLNDISAEEIFAAQTMIHQFVGPRAARNATKAQILELRDELARAAVALREDPCSVAPYVAINQAMHRSSGHPVAGVFSDALIVSQYGFVHPKIAASDEDMLAGHRRNLHHLSEMVEAFAEHDTEALMDIQRRMVDQTRRRLDRIQRKYPKAVSYRSLLSGKHVHAMGDVNGPQKSAIKLAYSIAAKVRREQMPVGAFIGSQKSLMAEGEISVAVFREATCLLEYFGVVEVRQGPQGGLFVSPPNPRHTIAAGARYLRYLQIEPAQGAEFRRHVMRSVVRQVAAAISVDDVMQVRSTVEACGTPTSAEHLRTQANSIARCILARSTNRAVRLIVEIMLELQMPGRFTEASARRIVSERAKYLKAFSEAYLRSDAADLEQNLVALLDLESF
jgi:DNA-binding FadR family transcriptional regulator